MKVSTRTVGDAKVRALYQSMSGKLRGSDNTIQVIAAGDRNATIANAQAAQDRNPFYSTASEHRKVTASIRDALNDWAMLGERAGRFSLNGPGELYVDNYRRHIRSQKSGGIPPIAVPTDGHRSRKLSKKYAAQKKKLYGAAPILVATGEFIASIKSRSVRT